MHSPGSTERNLSESHGYICLLSILRARIYAERIYERMKIGEALQRDCFEIFFE